jgi:protease-4
MLVRPRAELSATGNRASTTGPRQGLPTVHDRPPTKVSTLVIAPYILFGALGCMSCFALAGCRPVPVHVFADGQFAADANVAADARVTADIAPGAEAEPVVAMDLPAGTSTSSGPRVAIVDVDGLLVNSDMTGLGSVGDNPVSAFREKLDAVAADERVVAVVLRINSPGGGVTASDMMWHDLKQFKKQTQLPVVACVLDVGAGGAYYLATAADYVVAHPTSVVGGIGVILNLYNLRDTMAQFNVVAAPVKAGKRIDLGSPITALDDDGRKLLQTMADAFHERFRRVVTAGRPKADNADESMFDGRVFTAEQALQRGLIDHVGYLDEAITTACEMAGCRRVVATLYHRPRDRAESLYAVTPNVPLQGNLLPLSLPGLDRSRLPSFLYLWQLEPTMEKLGGK